MPGMRAVSGDVLYPAKVACRGNVLQRWQLAAKAILEQGTTIAAVRRQLVMVTVYTMKELGALEIRTTSLAG